MGLVDAVDDAGQNKGKCLAGAGLRDAHHVLTAQRNRETLRLDGGGSDIAGFRHLFHDKIGEVAVGELHNGVGYARAAAHQGDLVLAAEALHLARVHLLTARRGVVEVLDEGGQLDAGPIDGAQVAAGLLPLHTATITASAATVASAAATVASTAAATTKPIAAAATTTAAIASTTAAATITATATAIPVAASVVVSGHLAVLT